jgi:heterodisulfide reductase subunit C
MTASSNSPPVASEGKLPRSTPRESDLRAAFWHQVKSIPDGQKLKECLQCGTCTGSCPVSYAMDITPRQTVGLFRAGMIEDILKSRTIWLCASCYSCTVRCPVGIQVTDTLYALKRLAMEAKIYPDDFPVYALSKAFVSNVYRYGRNFELGLGVRYFLKASPLKLLGSAGMGLSMMKRGRMALRPSPIRGVKEVQAIIDRANELEGIQ